MKQNTYKWGLPAAVGTCLILTILKMCGLIAIGWALCLCSDMGAYCIDLIACTRIVLQYYNKF